MLHRLTYARFALNISLIMIDIRTALADGTGAARLSVIETRRLAFDGTRLFVDQWTGVPRFLQSGIKKLPI